MEEGPAWALRRHGAGCLCVKVRALKICVWLCSGGRAPPQPRRLRLDQGGGGWGVGWRPALLASPCKCWDCPFRNTQTNYFIPEAL